MNEVEKILQELENTEGPCAELCLYCPAQRNLKPIYDIIKKLYEENLEMRGKLEKIENI